MNEPCGVVFVGRSNSTKRSDTFPRISGYLSQLGYSMHWFESDRAAASRRINDRMSLHCPWIAASIDRNHPLYRRMIRLLIKGLLVMSGKQRWDFLRAAIFSRPVAAAQELDRFINKLPMQRIHLVAHSAGGIAATKNSANPKVASICCFGYPFKHPDRLSESYRTRHLSAVTKPLLIIQGASDEYGPASHGIRSLLPPQTQIVATDCDHDYANLSDAEFDKAWIAIKALIGAQPSVKLLQNANLGYSRLAGSHDQSATEIDRNGTASAQPRSAR